MINNSQSLFHQQLGFSKWKNYDSSLQRLRCSKDEEINGIWGSEETENEDIDTPTFACKFSKMQGTDHLLALANEDGKLVLHDTNKKEKCYGKQIHQNAIFDIAWLCDAFKLVTVSGDNTAKLVDMSRDSLDVVQIFTGHTRSVKTVVGRPHDSSIFATGSHDGSIRVWDIRSSSADGLLINPDRVIQNSHSRTTPSSRSKKRALVNSVTGLVFYNDDTLISCGSGDGLIKIWDMRKTYATSKDPLPKSIIPYSGHTTRNGFSNLVIDIEKSKLYANCLDNTIYSYNIGTFNVNPVMEYRGHLNSSYYIKSSLSEDGMYILSGSSDQNAYIWNVNTKVPVVKLSGHTAEVTCVAWRKSGDLTLVTCSDDVRHKIWKIGPEILPDNWEVDGRGSAETIIQTPKTKRLIESNENTPVSNKKARLMESNKRSSDELLFGDIKRFHPGRRLFEITNNAAGSSREDDTLATILEEEKELYKTPKASLIHHGMALISPEKFSPTSNLPNFVVDGSAPHLHFSPQKQRDKDWLTKMRVEKRLIREIRELGCGGGGSTSPKVPKLEDRTTKRKTPSRRKSSSSPHTPILKFFRATNNSILKDSHCSPKSSILH